MSQNVERNFIEKILQALIKYVPDVEKQTLLIMKRFIRSFELSHRNEYKILTQKIDFRFQEFEMKNADG